MTVYTSRFGFQWNYQAHDAGWGNDFNYTMRALAVLLDCYLTSDTVTTPPGSPSENDAYYVPATATGVWSTNTGKITVFQGGAWQYYTPERGTRAYIASRTGFYWFNGTLWLAEATSGAGGGVLTVAGHSPDISGNVSLVVGDITGAAPLSSPALTGTPTAPNATALSRSTQIANTKYVDDAVTAVTSGAVTSVAGRSGAVTLAVADVSGAAPLASPALTGTPTATTASSGNNSTRIATTAYVDAATAGAGAVTSVAGRTGVITLTHSDLTDWSSATSTFLTSSSLSSYVAKAGDTMTGDLHLAAPAGSDNTDKAVSSAWVRTYVDGLGFGTGSGTVTSVAMTVPGDLSVSGSPITGSGTLAITRANQNANLVLAGPSTGSAATPAYRSLVAADLPAISSILDGISSTRGAILYRGSSAWSALTPGTSGNYLQTNGAGADPTWTTVSSGGGSADVQTFTAGGTWTKPSGAKSVTVIVYGGGGGGGGGVGGAAGTTRAGGTGGGGGARHEHTFAAVDLTSTVTVTVGAGGTAGTGGSSGAGVLGTAGGQSSFGTYLSAFGGGNGYPNTAAASNASGGGGGGVGGAGSGGGSSSVSGGLPASSSTTGIGGAGGGATNSLTGSSAEYGGAGGGGYATSTGSGATGGSSLLGGGGGGGAGGLSAANAVGAPQAGGSVRTMTAGGGGTAGSSGSAGGAGSAGDSSRGGAGGGGGAPSASTTGGAGGAGGANGGGGGGGAGGTSTGGAGGAGGAGAVYVITYF